MASVRRSPSLTPSAAEVKFRQVAVRMLLGTMLIDTLHAALEDRIEALNRVRGDHVGSVANVFLCTMVDRIMTFELTAHSKTEVFTSRRKAGGNMEARHAGALLAVKM